MARLRWSPLIETSLFVGFVLLLDGVWGTGDRFGHLNPHPFWIIVLAMAAQYGTSEALAATLVSTAALLAGKLPPQSFGESIHDYTVRVLTVPVLWMIASFVLGELRGRHRQQHAEVVEQLNNAERRVSLLSRSYEEVTTAKDRLETRLAGQLKTATDMFEAARALETLEPTQVLEGAADLLGVALNAKAFSIYLLEHDRLVLATHQGTSDTSAPVDRLGATSPLFREVIGAQRLVTVATPVGESILAGQGLMAGPLVEPSTGKVLGMLKIETMSFLDFNLSSVRTFKAMCDWIGAAYANAISHKDSQLVDDTTKLYGMRHLEQQTAYLTEIALRFGFDLSLLYIKLDVDDLPDEERRAVWASLGIVAQKVLRRTDLVFGQEASGGQFAVLLPGTPTDHALVVKSKIEEGLRAECGRPVPGTSRVRTLCRANEKTQRSTLRSNVIESDLVA